MSNDVIKSVYQNSSEFTGIADETRATVQLSCRVIKNKTLPSSKRQNLTLPSKTKPYPPLKDKTILSKTQTK